MQMLKNHLPILTPDYSTLAENYSFKPQGKQLALNVRGARHSLSGCRLGCSSLGQHTTPRISDRQFQHSAPQALHPTSCCLLKQDIAIAKMKKPYPRGNKTDLVAK